MMIDKAEPSSDSTALTELIGLIQQGDRKATDEFCCTLSRGLTFLLRRRIGPQDFEDAVQDVVLEILQAIRRGALREPAAVFGYAKTIAIRKSAAYIAGFVSERNRTLESAADFDISDKAAREPEQGYIAAERIELAKRTLALLKPRDREILQRFYVHEQSQEKICEEMRLTSTQFRLIKSRAKAKFGELGRAIQNKHQSPFTAPRLPTSLPRCA